MIEDPAPRRRQDQVAVQACLQPRTGTKDWFSDCLMEPRRAVRDPQAVKGYLKTCKLVLLSDAVSP
jgi:hypothetical protein